MEKRKLSFILTMRNVNLFPLASNLNLSMSFILTMRNVNDLHIYL
ncbi:hypothetical protein AC1_1220 [Clostridium perfringens B str. ATCC 3626]|uniref:Uncharacterized protein n=1 Tax=Clostridium perfringens B str. ATCC 3626 TaxID=451754 RepID=A0AAV3BMM0_CLOPF|nr:hypothetical protein AC1_1220 [Clostridium perfringens B str. ATCC 3626]